MIDVGVIRQEHIGKRPPILVEAEGPDCHIFPEQEFRRSLLGLLAIGLTLLRAIDQPQSNPFSVASVRDFDRVAVELALGLPEGSRYRPLYHSCSCQTIHPDGLEHFWRSADSQIRASGKPAALHKVLGADFLLVIALQNAFYSIILIFHRILEPSSLFDEHVLAFGELFAHFAFGFHSLARRCASAI